MFRSSAIVLGVLSLAFPGVAAAQPYCVTDLGAGTLVTGINSNGQIVGTSGSQAFVWSNGTMTNLGMPAGFISSYGYGINDSGNVVGWGGALSSSGVYTQQGIAYVGGQWQVLSSTMEADSITDNGTITGMTSGGTGFVLTGGPSGTLTDLGPRTQGQYNGIGSAYAINGGGTVVGGWTLGAPQDDNGTPMWYCQDGIVSQVYADEAAGYGGGFFGVSDSGIAAGMVGGTEGSQPVAYSIATGDWTYLRQTIAPQYQYGKYTPTLSSDKFEGMDAATAIAPNGDIVGAVPFRKTLYADGAPVPYASVWDDAIGNELFQYQHAFIYTGGVTVDLNTYINSSSGWLLQGAMGIAVVNGQEWIVGDGVLNGNGVTHAFLMRPAMPGDANADGNVDINDLTIVLTNYGQTGMTWSQGEFTGDGTVDINDLTIVLANYGSGAGAPLAAVPEPGALMMLTAAIVGLLAWTRRTRK
jgi:probable HAF family extracellular repeat protein